VGDYTCSNKEPNIMSIHIKLSKEAEDKMNAQRRNSTILSLLFSGLFIALILVVFGLIALNVIQEPQRPDITCEYETVSKDIPIIDPPDVPKSVISKPKAPAGAAKMAKSISVNAISSISIPEVDTVAVNNVGFAMSDVGFTGDGYEDFGTNGPGKDLFDKIQGPRSKRCSKEDRLARLKEMGGKVESEDVVERGLEWLKVTQKADGSWSNKYVSAMTGFGILAYLGRCETPISQKYGDSCSRAIIYLVDIGMKNDGKLVNNTADKHWPYEHAIATYALCEAMTFCKQLHINIPNLSEVTEKSVNVIIENQHEKSGGWDYAYDKQGNRGGDLSIAAWHIQALKAASYTGLEIRGLKSAQSKAIEYVENLQGDNGGFGYTGKPSGETYAKLTGAGVLSLQMSNKKHESAIRKGAKHVLEFSKFDYAGKDSNLYSLYYESQAMIARGGSEWKKFNENFSEQLINSQNPDGSWKLPGSGSAYADPHYRTCLNILMLEVYYRFLPGTGKL
jgi:hypothetical protein